MEDGRGQNQQQKQHKRKMFRDSTMFPPHLPSDTEQPPLPHQNDTLDDIFGSSPPSPTNAFALNGNRHAGNTEPSDIPRLQEKHETEGYRDGVTKGKGETVQTGFDEGYGLGAVMGLRIGRILGVLEGLYYAVASDGGEGRRVKGLWEDGKRELRTERVFGVEWWGEDGIWRFDVPGEGKGGSEVVFGDVVGAHPLVRRWEGVVGEECGRWGVDLGVLENEQLDEQHTMDSIVNNADTGSPPKLGGQKPELSW